MKRARDARVGLAVVFALASGAARPLRAAAPVAVVRASPRPVTQRLTVVSTLIVENEIAVTTRVSGVIDSILVSRGEAVRKGQRLAVLDQREFELDRQAAEAAYSVAKADDARYEELARQKLASQAELEQRQARFKEAEVALERARLVLDRSVIRAPFDGVVVERQAKIGEKVLVEESTPLFKVSALGPLEARVYLPENWLGRLRRGQAVRVQAADFPGAASSGEITFLSPVLDAGTGSFLAMIRVRPDARRMFRSGLSVRISFDARVRGWLLPASCVVGSPASAGASRVFLVEGGRLAETAVRVEPAENGQVLVTAGLPAQASVVRDAAAALRGGMAVQARP